MDTLTFLAFPKSHHRKIRSTNVLERFNKEVKRRTKVVGAFPNENSVLRLLVPLAVDTNAKWLDRKYLSWDNLVQSENAEEEFTRRFLTLPKRKICHVDESSPHFANQDDGLRRRGFGALREGLEPFAEIITVRAEPGRKSRLRGTPLNLGFGPWGFGKVGPDFSRAF